MNRKVKDNRPPMEERTLTRGDVREDGMVFCKYAATCKNGERWVTADKMKEVMALQLATGKRNYARIRGTSKFKSDRKRYASKWYHGKGKETSAAYAKKYVAENRDAYNEYHRKYTKERRANDDSWRIQMCLRSRLSHAIKAQNSSKSANTMELTGCDIIHLMSHLESQFSEVMTWENHGSWHIDHIKPCASFDFSLDRDQRACFHYTNLQPLWAEDNFKKGDRY